MRECQVLELEHTADWQIQLWASDMRQLLICAAQAMFRLLGAQAEGPPGGWQSLSVSADDHESLLVHWLEELLFVHDSTGKVPVAFELHDLQTNEFEGRLRWAAATRPHSQIKGVTYHDLHVQQLDNGLQTVITFDV